MNEIPKHSNYGSSDRFPPSDDVLNMFVLLKTEKEQKKWNLCSKVWNIFCECCSGNNDEPF
jgi:hypothetical protein